MSKWTGKILVPAILVGIAAIQSFGIDAGRALYFLPCQDSTALFLNQDTTEHFITDSVTSDYGIQDSIPPLSARDTIVAPDSLRETDPVRFRYYVELRDSATRAQTRDSLMAAADTAELMVLDSLYIKDSTDIAKAEFDLWYKSLTRKERKKYDAEKALPAKIARMDSIMHRKDSLKAARDSIIEVTPRILETYAVADSLQYKRILMWEHERYFSNLELKQLDTTYNYHFNDYPFLKNDVNASYLGVVGSAAQNYNYFKRNEEENVVF